MLGFLLALQVAAALPPDVEPRYCYPTDQVPRTAAGVIKRSGAARYRFRLLHPCPATGMTTGACPGWAIDHVIPLACGGCDAVDNMQWLPAAIKSCAGSDCKDRWERTVYCAAQ